MPMPMQRCLPSLLLHPLLRESFGWQKQFSRQCCVFVSCAAAAAAVCCVLCVCAVYVCVCARAMHAVCCVCARVVFAVLCMLC